MRRDLILRNVSWVVLIGLYVSAIATEVDKSIVEVDKPVAEVDKTATGIINPVADDKEESGLWKYFKEPGPDLISISNTEGKGMGYSKGYSSLDLLLAFPLYQNFIIPFTDLRGHIFNDGKYAANAGLGIRFQDKYLKRVWGFNAFYDYLLTSHRPYNQVSIGLESLGTNWDARINGYLPVGVKETPLYEFAYGDIFSGEFSVKGKEQFAMRGIDSEVAYHYCALQSIYVYAGIGPYYYWGKSAATTNAFRANHEHAVGGRLRTRATFLSYIVVEGTTSYDHLFKWTGQATLSLVLPFDLTCYTAGKPKKSYCLKRRLFDPVIRNEIIAVKRIHRYSTDPDILDPENNP